MRILTTLAILILIAVVAGVNAQEAANDNVVGQNFELQSKQLEETREIQIYLPPAYNESQERRFVTLYVLDSQEYFLHGIAYQDMLRFRDKSPDIIVIGIKSDRKKRRQFYYRKSGQFMRFLADELIPYIDKTYRTLAGSERIYFGWEMAAGLGLEICYG